MNPSPDAKAHEDGFVASFIDKRFRDRWQMLLASPKRRAKITRELSVSASFVDTATLDVTDDVFLAERALFEICGDPDVHLISYFKHLDGTSHPLRKSFRIVLRGHTVISILPGRLAYWEGDPYIPGTKCAILMHDAALRERLVKLIKSKR
jgi:hypothetical protein